MAGDYEGDATELLETYGSYTIHIVGGLYLHSLTLRTTRLSYEIHNHWYCSDLTRAINSAYVSL